MIVFPKRVTPKRSGQSRAGAGDSMRLLRRKGEKPTPATKRKAFETLEKSSISKAFSCFGCFTYIYVYFLLLSSYVVHLDVIWASRTSYRQKFAQVIQTRRKMAAEGVDALEPITKIPPSTQRVPTEYPIELQRSSMQMRQNPRIPVYPKHKNQETKTLAVDLAYHIAAVYKAVLTNLVEIFDGKLYESETSTTPISKKRIGF